MRSWLLVGILLAVMAACSKGVDVADTDEEGVGGRKKDAGTQTCQPASCASLGAECGSAPDGCGSVVSCGECNNAVCGGAGPNRCGSSSCVPTNPCVTLNLDCGPISDGCSDVVQCGTCTAPAVCGGGGIPNRCSLGAGGSAGSDASSAAGSGGSDTCATHGQPCGTVQCCSDGGDFCVTCLSQTTGLCLASTDQCPPADAGQEPKLCTLEFANRPACNSCAEQMCAQNCVACLSNPECKALSECVLSKGCAPFDPSCQQSCSEDHPDGLAGALSLRNCLGNQCAEQCK